jgi:glycosyltransferase involved in cell wall biosynthesis
MLEVIKQVPNAKYLLVGGGDDEERMKGIIKELGLENHVIMPGRASDEDMIDYYNLADVFAYPSKNEGFPAIVLLEALACGKPVIGGHYGEKSEKEIFNDKLGYIIDPDDRQKLAESIVNILRGKAPKDFFNADLIRKRVLDEYGKDRFEKRVGEILELFKTFRLAVFMSHPIQYQTPFLKEIAATKEIDLTAYFLWNFGVNKTFEKDFGRDIQWDIPILEGYRHKFLRNFSPKPSSDFWGTLNFGAVSELIKNRYDAVLVYGWNYFANWLIFLTAFILGTKVFISGESPFNQEIIKPAWKINVKKLFLRPIFHWASAIFYIGSENKKFYKYYGVSDKKLFFAPYAIDNNSFIKAAGELKSKRDEMREKMGIKKSDVVILFAGKLVRKKRPFDLIKAFQLLVDAYKTGVVLRLIYVGDGKLRPSLESFAKENNLNNIHFAGFKNQTELPEYYAMADVFVLPSGPGETWGLVTNEAMCFGLPIIVSDMVGCGPDLVSAGENGFVFPAGDIDKLAGYLKELIEDREKRKKFGKKSFEIIRNYSYDKGIEGILRALK